MPARKRTKIIATLGPASDDRATLKALIQNGVDIIRVNFSHGDAAAHTKRVTLAREVAKELGCEIGVMADLQGPKIRIAKFKDDSVELTADDAFCLDAELDIEAGDNTQVGIDYKNLPKDVKAGDTLLLNDGRIVLEVSKVNNSKIHCKVKVGGTLANNKGINRQGGGLSAEALTEKDREDLKTAVAFGADYIALSCDDEVIPFVCNTMFF